MRGNDGGVDVGERAAVRLADPAVLCLGADGDDRVRAEHEARAVAEAFDGLWALDDPGVPGLLVACGGSADGGL